MSEKIGKVFGEFLEKEIFDEEKVQEKQPVKPTKVNGENFIDRGDYIELAKPVVINDRTTIHAIEKYGSPEGVMSIKEAYDYAKKLNAEKMGGFSDWRLPNRYELKYLKSVQDECGINFKGGKYASARDGLIMGYFTIVLGHPENCGENSRNQKGYYVICVR